MFKAGDAKGALKSYRDALRCTKYNPDLYTNIALCCTNLEKCVLLPVPVWRLPCRIGLAAGGCVGESCGTSGNRLNDLWGIFPVPRHCVWDSCWVLGWFQAHALGQGCIRREGTSEACQGERGKRFVPRGAGSSPPGTGGVG